MKVEKTYGSAINSWRSSETNRWIGKQKRSNHPDKKRGFINFLKANKKCLFKERKPDVHEKKYIANYLDYDSLAKIFMFLPIPERIIMEQVCPRWKEACELAWHDIKKYKCGISIGRDYNNRLLTQSYVQKILFKCGIYLKELSLSDVCKSSIIPIVGDCCKNLTRLEFVFDGRSKSHNTNNYVQAFTQLEKLEYIKIQVITMNKKKHLSVFPIEILDNLPEGMIEIHLLFNSSSQKKNRLFFNLNKFKLLKSLTMSFCNLDKMIQDITEKTTLVYLDIENSWVSKTRQSSPMFNKLVNLEYFKFLDNVEQDLPVMSSDGVLSIFNTCKNLRHFESKVHITIWPPNSLIKWVNLENLVYLRAFSGLDLDLAEYLVQYCQKLKYLIIDSFVPADALIKLAELENLETLKVLTIQEFPDEQGIVAISNCKKLKHVEIPDIVMNLPNPDRLFAPFVKCFHGQLSKLQYLEHLDMSSGVNVDNETIVDIASKCKNLKYLNIQECNKISKVGLDALTTMENLQELIINRNRFITDDFIVKLKGFKRLNLNRCRKITHAGIIELIKNCPDLEILQIHSVKITLDTIIAADEITRNRINGVILRISVQKKVLKKAAELIIKSQWLVIERVKR